MSAGCGAKRLTFPGTADDLGPHADSPIVLAIWIDPDLGGKDDGLEGVLHLTVGVDVAREDLQKR